MKDILNSRVSSAQDVLSERALVGHSTRNGTIVAEASEEVTGIASAQDVEAAVAYIEQAFHIQMERQQIIVDAALLAAEQVQDKRIEVLEQGKNVTIEDVLFELLSVYLWEVGIIGHVLTPLIKEVTSVICAKTLVWEAVYDRLPKTDYGAQLIGMARAEKDSQTVIRSIIQDHVSSTKRFASEDYAMFAKSVTDIVTKAPDTAASQVKSAIKNWKQLAAKVKGSSLKTTDTPNVALLKAAQSYVSRNRTALAFQKSHIIAVLRAGQPYTRKELKDFLTVFQWEELPPASFIRDQYQLALEVVIWAQLYRFKPNDPASPEVLINSGEIRGVNRKIVDYWIIRFKDVLEPYDKISKAPWDTMPRGIQCRKIKAYFEDISKNVKESSQGLRPIDEVFVVQPDTTP
ncbi:hypothetical protein ACFO9Q_00190 [Paenibacillus sp. GCM10023252]|uniref:hypothetical protein n=1 Tax=Paenibacillus sp. GCM10023252 TaxID=3252649 RepID=UPI0036238E2A